MDLKQINVNQITCIKVFEKQLCREYEYLEAIKLSVITLRKEGYYDSFRIGGKEFYTKEKIEKNKKLFCEDKKVYYRPHIEIVMSNNRSHYEYFESVELMYNFIQKNESLSSVKWLYLKG